MNKRDLISFFNATAPQRDAWKKRSSYYYRDLMKLLRFIVPEQTSVVEIGCGTGDFIDALKPSRGVGIDISPAMIRTAQSKYPSYEFIEMDAEHVTLDETFNYVIMSDLIGHLDDVQQAFQEVQKITNEQSRLIVTYYNCFWEPFLRFAEKIRLKMPEHRQNWLNQRDIENLLGLAGFEVIKKGQRFLVPRYVPLISSLCNRYLSQLPLFKHFCLYHYIVAKTSAYSVGNRDYSISVIIPVRNEKDNIESAVQRVPQMGKHVELIFVEGNSSDGTLEEIQRVVQNYGSRKDVKYFVQDGVGKGDAVRKGFQHATGDILCILDADLTVPPEDLPKFYEAIASGKAEFVNGCRLVYTMEKEAMRSLNILGNKFFSLMFTWLLGQRIKDTLCGTKAMFRKDYELLAKNRSYFGEFDPFGDFDLIFGASKLSLKIVELPVRYRERAYGATNISRFRHGLLLLKMSVIAMRKIKFV